MDPADQPWRLSPTAILLRVRLTPKGGRDAIDGLTPSPDGMALKARVRAAPEDGQANEALERLISDWIGVPRRAVALAAGQKSRSKLVELTGDVPSIDNRLRALIAVLQN